MKTCFFLAAVPVLFALETLSTWTYCTVGLIHCRSYPFACTHTATAATSFVDREMRFSARIVSLEEDSEREVSVAGPSCVYVETDARRTTGQLFGVP